MANIVRSRAQNRARTSYYLNTTALGLCMACAVTLASPARAGGALPSNGQYLAGQGSIASTGNQLTVNQTSNHGIINWQSFSIGQGNSVLINNGSGATLNRVTGGQVSQIDGSLKATGSVYLINPQGIVIGPTGQVIANGSFVASTRDVSNNAFMNGGAFTASSTSSGSIVNQGVITSNTGDAILVGSSVTNTGSISAPNGTVGLAAGNEITLQPAGSDPRIAISGGTGSVTNSGNIRAAQAELNAAGGNVYAVVENNGGAISATGTQTINGHVWLTAGGTGTVTVQSTISAQNANGAGGAVTVRGDNINVPGSINVSASTATGQGGSVSIVASNNTAVSGSVHAAGGSSGQGGNIETSGLTLSFGGSGIDAGHGGNWLLDPYDLTVDSTAATTIDASLNAGTSVKLQTSATGTSGPGNANPNGVGNINITSALSWNTSATLNLVAFNSINIDAAVTSQGNGIFVATASSDINIAAPVTVSSRGNLDLSANHNLNIGAAVAVTGTTGAAAVNLTADSAPNFTSDGNLTFASTSDTLKINGTSYTLVNGYQDLINMSASGDYALAQSFNLNSSPSESPLAKFNGTFEGLGNTISGLKFFSSLPASDLGLFSVIGPTGVVRDLNLTNETVSETGDSKLEPSAVGGLAGVLQGTVINDFTSGTVSNAYGNTGGLIGEADVAGINPPSISLSHSSATVSGAGADASDFGNTGGLVGENNGTISLSYASGNVTGSLGYAGGLVGSNSGPISQSAATGSISGVDGAAGGLAGYSGGYITQSHASGSVTTSATGAVHFGSAETAAGGLVGFNAFSVIDDSYATGNVTANSTAEAVGGLVGVNIGDIQNSYAAGAVNASGGSVGGLGGYNAGTITDSYAIGAVGGSGNLGGLVGHNTNSITQSYYDAGTTGASVGSQSDGSVGETTAQLQGALPSGFSSSVWGTGAGLYPYLLSQYPAGAPQVITGTAYAGGGVSPLKAGAVSIDLNGTNEGTVSTGANGYYYVPLAPNTISASGAAVLAYESGSANGARLYTLTGTTTGFDIWNATLIAPTSATTYSTANATTLQAQDAALIAEAIGANTDPTVGLANYGYIASGGGFTIDQPITTSNGLFVTTISGDITVAAPLTASGNLDLNSAGNLNFDAPVVVTGAAATSAANLAGSLNLASGSDVTFASTSDKLVINGASYTLLNSLDAIINMSANGDYALANSFNVSSFLAGAPVGSAFNGTFEGFGNTINGLKIFNAAAGSDFGLFSIIGQTGVVRDLNLTNETITDIGDNPNAPSAVGGLAGLLQGTVINDSTSGIISNAYGSTGGLIGAAGVSSLHPPSISLSHSSATVSGSGADANDFGYTGGLVGSANATISMSYASGKVTGSIGYVGGLVGITLGTISQSWATGAVSGTDVAVGGLGGYNGGHITESYATGSVTASDTGTVLIRAGSNDAVAGGLVGVNEYSVAVHGVIDTSYATGDVTAESAREAVGGLVGANFSPPTSPESVTNVTQSYATGTITINGTGFEDVPGGIFGDNSETEGASADLYYNLTLNPNANALGWTQGGTGLTTAQSQGALPSGFNPAIWGTGPGIYPYLIWEYPIAPQAISGFASNAAAGSQVGVYANGVLLAGGTASVGSNGYFYETVPSGTITSSTKLGETITPVSTSTVSGLTYTDQPTLTSGNVSNFDVTSGAISETTAEAKLSALNSDVAVPFGAAYASIASELSSVAPSIRATNASGFTVDQSAALPGLTLDSTQGITFDAPVTISGGGHVVLTTNDGGTGGNLSFGLGASGFTGSIAFTGAEGSGQSLTVNGKVYDLVFTASELENINANLGDDYALAQAINASSIANWIPLGTDGTGHVLNGDAGFSGIFEGLGNTVSNLTVNTGATSYAGLFGWSTGNVLDIAVSNANVTGGGAVGGLVGENLGRVSDTVVANSTIVGSGYGTGGFVGFDARTGTITASAVSAVTVNGAGGVGGFVGLNDGSLPRDSVTGSTVDNSVYGTGGFAGQNATAGNITNASVTSTIVDGQSYVGGFVGNNAGSINDSSASTTSGSGYAVTGVGYVGGFAGENQASALIQNSSSSDTLATAVYGSGNRVGGFAGWNAGNFSNDQASDAVSGAAQVGGFVGWNDGDITNGGVQGATITGTQFGTGGFVGYNTNSGGISSSNATSINVNGAGGVGGFAGLNGGTLSLDGVSGSTIDDATASGTGGFAGQNAAGAHISNDTVISTVVAGASYTGGFAGTNYGTISGSSVSTTTSDGAYAVSGDGYVGGFAGLNEIGGSITGSGSSNTGATAVFGSGNLVGGFVGRNQGSLTSDQSSDAVAGAEWVAGLVGWNDSSISDSTASGAVSATSSGAGGLVGYNGMNATISQSFATGSVMGGGNVGGLVGDNLGDIENAYATGSASAATATDVGGLVGTNGGTIKNVYAAGSVPRLPGSTGALVGYNTSAGSITNAYYDTAITRSQPGVGINDGTADVFALGGSGEPGAAEASSYVGFNFTTIWTIAPGQLPTLINAP